MASAGGREHGISLKTMGLSLLSGIILLAFINLVRRSSKR
jgi:hypothetical protein